MKEEEHNNWRLICEELEAINHNEKHLDILRNINEGNPLDIDDDSAMKEFSFSYPGLVWLMMKIFPGPTMSSFLISQGLHLKEIEMQPEYIAYIRDLKTASKINKLYPSVYDENIVKQSIGRTFWELANCVVDGDIISDALINASKEDNTGLFRVLEQNIQIEDPRLEEYMFITLYYGFFEAFYHLLTTKNPNQKTIKNCLMDAVKENRQKEADILIPLVLDFIEHPHVYKKTHEKVSSSCRSITVRLK